MRGEYKGVSGKIVKVSTEKNGVAVEGIKKEKLKGGNLDVFIHTSNLLVTDLNTEDKWRQNKLEGKNPKPVKDAKPKEEPKQEKPKEIKKEPETKEKQKEKPVGTKSESKKETKTTKATKPKTVKRAKKEDK
jgi:large subunit ribosomal protein L24